MVIHVVVNDFQLVMTNCVLWHCDVDKIVTTKSNRKTAVCVHTALGN